MHAARLSHCSGPLPRVQVKAPQITSFKFHSQMLISVVAVSFLVYTTYAQSMQHTPYAPYFTPGNIILSFFPSWMLRFSWGLLIFCHGLESLYVAYLCRKHSTGLVVGVSCSPIGSPPRAHVHAPTSPRLRF